LGEPIKYLLEIVSKACPLAKFSQKVAKRLSAITQQPNMFTGFATEGSPRAAGTALLNCRRLHFGQCRRLHWLLLSGPALGISDGGR